MRTNEGSGEQKQQQLQPSKRIRTKWNERKKKEFRRLHVYLIFKAVVDCFEVWNTHNYRWFCTYKKRFRNAYVKK